jgi:hypothetical protein
MAEFGCDPLPLPCFLEVLILEELQRDFSEVLIPVGLKSFGMNVMRGFLEVLILEGLKSDFSEVLILEELRRERCEIKRLLRGKIRYDAHSLPAGRNPNRAPGAGAAGFGAGMCCSSVTIDDSMSANALSRLSLSYSNTIGPNLVNFKDFSAIVDDWLGSDSTCTPGNFPSGAYIQRLKGMSVAFYCI